MTQTMVRPLASADAGTRRSRRAARNQGPWPEPVRSDALEGPQTLLSVVLAVFTLGYLLPGAIAITRGSEKQDLVLAVNIVAGWTGIGWIACLIWACIDGLKPAPVPAIA